MLPRTKCYMYGIIYHISHWVSPHCPVLYLDDTTDENIIVFFLVADVLGMSLMHFRGMLYTV